MSFIQFYMGSFAQLFLKMILSALSIMFESESLTICIAAYRGENMLQTYGSLIDFDFYYCMQCGIINGICSVFFCTS